MERLSATKMMRRSTSREVKTARILLGERKRVRGRMLMSSSIQSLSCSKRRKQKKKRERKTEMSPRATHHGLTGLNLVMRTSGRANVHSSISGSNTWSSGTIDWAETSC